MAKELASFRHSGKLGDIVYSLPAVTLFRRARYYINADRAHTDEHLAGLILPLLQVQPYIEQAKLWEGEPFDFNLDRFRQQDPVRTNLADCHLKAMSLTPRLRDRQWLFVDPTPAPEDKPVVFARSGAWRGVEGFWETCYERFGREARFVGTAEEHAKFATEVGPIEHVLTRDLLELAQVIAGCSLFVGNQSCPYAIAEGLKKSVIQEVFEPTPNCIFDRAGAAFVADSDSLKVIASCRT